MRIKLDENMPNRLIDVLTGLNHDADSVYSERLIGRPDSTVWQAAQEADRFLITQDLDFSDVRRFAPGTHHGLLLVRLHDPGRLAVANRVELLFRTENVE